MPDHSADISTDLTSEQFLAQVLAGVGEAWRAVHDGREVLIWREDPLVAGRIAAEIGRFAGKDVRLGVIGEVRRKNAAIISRTGNGIDAGLVRLVRTAYDLLVLLTFFTAGETESRAWTVRQGTKAGQAAGKIHSDMERGFIRAEVYHYDDLIACGNEAAVKEKGLFRLEGRDYPVKDGDVMFFRFNV